MNEGAANALVHVFSWACSLISQYYTSGYNCWVHSVNTTEDGPEAIEPPDASPTMDACPRCHIITKSGISMSLDLVVLVRVPFSLLVDVIYLLLASAAQWLAGVLSVGLP